MRVHEILVENIQGLRPLITPMYKGYELTAETGSASVDGDEAAKYLIDVMRRQAGPWLKSIRDPRSQVMYRGMKGLDPHTAVEVPTRWRGPRDTTIFYHHVFNTLLAAAGSVANRTNSVFVTGSSFQAAGYGAVYVYIPLGDFNYAWSIWQDWTHDLSSEEIWGMLLPLQRRKVLKMVQDAESSSRDSEKVEYALTQDPAFQEIVKDPASYDTKQVHKNITVDQDLVRAIQSGNEILIHSDSGLYIDSNFYRDEVIHNL